MLKNRGWEGSTKCPFCSNEESRDHIFIHCPLARYAWSVVECAFDVKTYFRSVEDIISWVFRFPNKIRNVILVGIAAVMWSLWKTCNKACFDEVFPYDPSCVIAKTSYWLDIWAGLQIKGRRELQRRDRKSVV